MNFLFSDGTVVSLRCHNHEDVGMKKTRNPFWFQISIIVFFDSLSDRSCSSSSHQPGRLPCMQAAVSALLNLKVSLPSTPTLFSSEIAARGVGE